MGNHHPPPFARAVREGHARAHDRTKEGASSEKYPEALMPTVIRFNKKRYLASGVNLNELFDQIPEPIAYFDADNRLGACNLSFRDNFPIVVEADFLKRASSGPVSGQSTISYDSLT